LRIHIYRATWGRNCSNNSYPPHPYHLFRFQSWTARHETTREDEKNNFGGAAVRYIKKGWVMSKLGWFSAP